MFCVQTALKFCLAGCEIIAIVITSHQSHEVVLRFWGFGVLGFGVGFWVVGILILRVPTGSRIRVFCFRVFCFRVFWVLIAAWI